MILKKVNRKCNSNRSSNGYNKGNYNSNGNNKNNVNDNNN